MAPNSESNGDSAAVAGKQPSSSATAEPRAIAKGAAIMPRDFSISLRAKSVDAYLRSRGSERAQRMRGFEDQYCDIIDYIVRITHRIWEEKDVGYIYDTYSQTSRVYDDYGLAIRQ